MATGLLNALTALLGPLIAALPDWTSPTVAGVNSIAYYVRVVDYFVPIAGPMQITFGMLAALPAFLAFRFGLMVWSLARGGGPS